MRFILMTISFLGLLLTVGPSFLVYYGVIDFDTHQTVALIGTVLWIGTAPFWMNQSTPQPNQE